MIMVLDMNRNAVLPSHCCLVLSQSLLQTSPRLSNVTHVTWDLTSLFISGLAVFTLVSEQLKHCLDVQLLAGALRQDPLLGPLITSYSTAAVIK